VVDALQKDRHGEPDDQSDGMAAADPIDRKVLLGRGGLANLEHHAEVGSTMERARDIAEDAGAKLPAAVIADRQTLGRGRRGARWWQPAGSLAVSVVLDAAAATDGSPAPSSPPAIWSLACGVALAEAIAAVEPAVAPLVRWPNDIEARGRKLAGILVETAPGKRVIFGIGVNTTGSSQAAPPPLQRKLVTLPDITGRTLPRETLLVEFLPRFLRLLAEIDRDPARLPVRYRPLCALDGHPLTVFRGGEILRGMCRGIAADGALLLDTQAGRVRVVSGSLTDPAEVWYGSDPAS
jgi:BirA family transcriptional regulator, biotin operon repressor / biotin---[acetyl-CoA-carboxylase] ligase